MRGALVGVESLPSGIRISFQSSVLQNPKRAGEAELYLGGKFLKFSATNCPTTTTTTTTSTTTTSTTTTSTTTSTFLPS